MSSVYMDQLNMLISNSKFEFYANRFINIDHIFTRFIYI